MSRRGLSLLEVLVTAGLLLLVMSVLVGFLIPSLRRTAQGNERATLQAEAAMSLTRLERDFFSTSSAGLSLLAGDGTDITAVGIVPIKETSVLGTLTWQDFLVVYFFLPQQRKLYRRVVDAASGLPFDPARPPRVSPDELRTMCLAGKSNRLASNVDRFALSHGGEDAFQPPLIIELDLSRKVVSGDAVERFRYRRVLSLRNLGNPQ